MKRICRLFIQVGRPYFLFLSFVSFHLIIEMDIIKIDCFYLCSPEINRSPHSLRAQSFFMHYPPFLRLTLSHGWAISRRPPDLATVERVSRFDAYAVKASTLMIPACCNKIQKIAAGATHLIKNIQGLQSHLNFVPASNSSLQISGSKNHPV